MIKQLENNDYLITCDKCRKDLVCNGGAQIVAIAKAINMYHYKYDYDTESILCDTCHGEDIKPLSYYETKVAAQEAREKQKEEEEIRYNLKLTLRQWKSPNKQDPVYIGILNQYDEADKQYGKTLDKSIVLNDAMLFWEKYNKDVEFIDPPVKVTKVPVEITIDEDNTHCGFDKYGNNICKFNQYGTCILYGELKNDGKAIRAYDCIIDAAKYEGRLDSRVVALVKDLVMSYQISQSRGAEILGLGFFEFRELLNLV
jgi:hypothetical protein